MSSRKPEFTYLDELEAEAIYVIREVVGQFDNPCLLFSGGKDSIVLSHLSAKAFYPSTIPFPFVHIDTGHNFPEAIVYRDWMIAAIDARLIVGSVQDSIDRGTVIEETGIHASRNALQTETLLEVIAENQFDAAMGGARRDEEKSRAKERFFSFRNELGQWNPRTQRPELWNIFNGRKKFGEHFRVFPISNWTELDIWRYILREGIHVPSLYFAHMREVIDRNGVMLPISPFLPLKTNEVTVTKMVRFRTCGDMPITGAVESTADTVSDIIEELIGATISERGTRHDDKRSENSMEDRKKRGYF